MTMHMRMTLAEGAALHGLLEEAAGDIVIRTDGRGFIETASTNISEIGYDLSQWLFKPHLTDLTDRDHFQALTDHIARALTPDACENGSADWIEFPVRLVENGEGGVPQLADESQSAQAPFSTVWYALSLRAITAEDGEMIGALGLLRSVERMRALEGEVHSRTLVDPYTGLANRHAFCSALRRQIATGEGGAVALFEVDRMRAVFMQYGQSTADEIIWSFAKFLETMIQEGCELAQFDAERFCVLIPQSTCRECRRWAEEVLSTFASLTIAPSARSPRLSASAGLAPIADTVDTTLREAELALVMARAGGGMRVAEAFAAHHPSARIAL